MRLRWSSTAAVSEFAEILSNAHRPTARARLSLGELGLERGEEQGEVVRRARHERAVDLRPPLRTLRAECRSEVCERSRLNGLDLRRAALSAGVPSSPHAVRLRGEGRGVSD